MTVAIRCPLDDESEWLTIREASALVGVSVATLRRWCDAGEVRAYTTPGGHRRFARNAVLGLAGAAAGSRRPARVSCNGETRIRIIRAYRSELRRTTDCVDSLEAMSDRSRQQLRLHGTQMVGELVELLDATAAESGAHLARAKEAAAACGDICAREGLSLADAISLFVRFRRPFVHQLGAVVRGQERDAADATAVLEEASDALDQLLPEMVAGYRGGLAQGAA